MKNTQIETVVEYLKCNPGSTKAEIAAGTEIKATELTSVLKELTNQGGLVEEGTGKDKKLSITEAFEVPGEAGEPGEGEVPGDDGEPGESGEEGAGASELEIPVEDEQEPSKKGRDNTKYKFNGQEYGKGPLVRAVVTQFVSDYPKTTLKQLKEAFPDDLLKRFGILQEESEARSLSGARDRYFFKEEHMIKLGDKKMVAVCSQFTAENIKPFLKTAKALGYKIK